jgi:hypothetical protein
MGIHPPQTNTIRAPGSDGLIVLVRIRRFASNRSHQTVRIKPSASDRPHQVEAVQTLVKQIGAKH